LKSGPEHFGIAGVNYPMARSKCMLADLFGRILIPSAPVEHTRRGFERAVAELRQEDLQTPIGMLFCFEREFFLIAAGSTLRVWGFVIFDHRSCSSCHCVQAKGTAFQPRAVHF
jgi:hypothetical protein